MTKPADSVAPVAGVPSYHPTFVHDTMGKIADRLARKNDPLYGQAKEIVRAASTYVQVYGDDEFDALLSKLEVPLRELSPGQFDRLLSMAFDSAEPRCDAEDVVEVIEDALGQLCEMVLGANGRLDGYLVAIPVVVHAAVSWGLAVSETDGRIAQALIDTGLVVDDAEVSLLPRLLGAMEADILLHGEIYRLARLMAEGRMDEADELIHQAHDRVGMELPTSLPTTTDGASRFPSVGVIVAFVNSADAEPFPLAMELNHALEMTHDDERIFDDAAEAAADQAFEDVRAELVKAADVLARALGVSELILLDPPEDWFAGAATARRFERQTGARTWLNELANSHAAGDMGALCLDDDLQPIDAHDSWFEIRVRLIAGRHVIGSHMWHPLMFETLDECFEALNDFLDSAGLPTIDELDAATAAPRTRHGTVH